MLTKITQFVKENSNNILLFIVVFLLCLLSFGAGMLVQYSIEKQPTEFQQN